MSLKESNMLPLGTVAPDFTLIDTVTGKDFALKDLESFQALVIMFICNHCPYVLHVNEQLVKLARDYQPKGVSFIAISSNDVVHYPADSPAKMRETAISNGYTFPYLYDQTQEVAKAYDAACTPDIYLFDKDSKLVYRGQIDSSRPGSDIPVTGKDLRNALDAVLNGEPVSDIQIPSAGCNIKWK